MEQLSPVGEEFLRQRVAKAAALPPDQRSPDVSSFLDAWALLEEAAAALAPRPEGQPPASEGEQTEGLLKWLLVETSSLPHSLTLLEHPQLTLQTKQRHLAPLVTISVGPAELEHGRGAGWNLHVTWTQLMHDLADDLEQWGPPVDDLHLMVRLLWLADLYILTAKQVDGASVVLDIVSYSLARMPACAALQAALDTLQPRSAVAGWRPTLDHLHAVHAGLRAEVDGEAAVAAHLDGRSEDAVPLWQARRCWLERLSAFLPGHPRPHYSAADTALLAHSNDTERGAAHCLEALKHCQDALACARGWRSDWWLARSCWRLADWAAAGVQAVPPAQVAQLLQEAEAAYRRCAKLLPGRWVRILRRERDQAAKLARGIVQVHLRAQSPHCWQPALIAQAKADRPPVGQVLAQQYLQSIIDQQCSGCQRATLASKVCKSCKAARYCSRQCQVKHWPAHKQACKQAQAAAAGKDGVEAGSSNENGGN